jgi:rod shape-determining protein MreD
MIRAALLGNLILVASVIVQSTWFEAIAIFGVRPDLALVVLVWLSYRNGLVLGSIEGFITGIVQDFISAAPLGFHAFIKTAVAIAASLLHGSFYVDKLLIPILLCSIATIIKAISAVFLALLFAGKVHSYSFVERVLWIEVAYNGLAAPLIFFALNLVKPLVANPRNPQ